VVSSAPGAPGVRGTLAGRVALVTTLVALVAVLITGLVSAGLIRGAAQGEELSTLSRLARVVEAASQVSGGRAFDRALSSPRVTRGLGIVVVRLSAAGVPARRPDLVAQTPAGYVSRAVGGPPFAVAVNVGGTRYLLAGLPRTGGGGFLLYERAATAGAALTRPLRVRLLIALVAGLAVAALAGLVLARRLARPLQQAAHLAGRLATGERGVRLAPSGPVEIAELADSLNRLAAALTVSEGRQREFLLSVSHELRTPLTAIKGYAEALADGVVSQPDLPHTGQTMLAEATRLERLVSDLLDLARLGADDFRIERSVVDLDRLAQEAARVWSARCAREGVRFRLEAPGRPVFAETDPARLRQIVDGLAENALRVTPSGAPIVLALRVEGPAAILEIRDGGPGLTDDDLRVAFERSALYDRYRGVRRVGTGVGLALVAGLAARLGGSATAGHAPEGGARFSIQIPAARAPASVGP
jgi:two-component system OmpR family sensor kinase